MKTALTAAAAAKPRAVKRLWFPALAVLLAGTAITILWSLPEDRLGTDQRNFYTVGTAAFGIIALTVWVVALSGLVALVRVSYLILLAAVLFSVRADFNGDMRPRLYVWWLDQRQSKLRAHRANQTRLPKMATLPAALTTDVPGFRGIHRDGVMVGPPLNLDWKASPPKELWRQPVGGGYAGLVGVGPLLVTIEQRGRQEAVVCYDAATGTERWAHEYAADFRESLGGPGPRATPTIDDDRVYSLGAAGQLACLDLLTGKPLWARNILEGNTNLQWGMSGSPLIVGDLVIVNPGCQIEAAKGRALLALDKKTGETRWTTGSTSAGYSSPQLAVLAGQEQILLFDGEGLGAYELTNGNRLWWFSFPTYQGINAAQPLVLPDDRVYISAGYGVGGAMLHVSKSGGSWETKSLWRNTKLKCKFSSPVLYEGFLYGLDDGILACLNARDGQQKWKGGRYGHGQILLTNGTIFVQCEDGHIALVRATPVQFEELASFMVFASPKNWNTPLLMNGRVYLRNHEEMAAYDLRSVTPAAAIKH